MASENIEMKIESPAFASNEPIPSKFSCEGADVSPPLSIAGIPATAVSLAIIVDDPDAPMGTFVHWVAWNIDAVTTTLGEGFEVSAQGRNDFGESRYRGPCPPPGKPHRYFFKIYALDTSLDLPEGTTKEHLLSAMEGHILGQGELIGTYQR